MNNQLKLLAQMASSPPNGNGNAAYIFFLPSSKPEWIQATRECGYYTISLQSEPKGNIADNEDLCTTRKCTATLAELLFTSTEIKNHVFVAAGYKSDNEALVDFFKANGLRFLEAWKIFKNLPKDTTDDTRQIIKDRIKAFVEMSEKNREEAKKSTNLDRFHIKDANGNIKGVFHDAIYEYIKGKYHLFVLGGTVYIYRDGVYKPDTSGAYLKTVIKSLIYPEYRKASTIKNIFELFLMDVSLEKSFDELNSYPAHWINFKNGLFDPKEKKMIAHDPKYLCINQLAQSFDPSANPEGQVIEKWLHFIVPETDDREMLLQFVGYCMTRDTSQQKFVILNGEGGSGKSTLIRLIEEIVGGENISSISLTELTQRFASFGLMGMLLNSCADLEISALEDTSTLKKALGEDRLRAEQKGHDAISFKSYAKMIFSTNELPTVRSERTSGFYRRLLILTMNRIPEHKRADFFETLSAELEYFIHISIAALERMYEAGQIIESRGSSEAIKQMQFDSDTVAAWLQEEVYRVPGNKINRVELYNKYSAYCNENERQSLARTGFFKALRSKGFSERKSNGINYIEGISLEKPSLTSSLSGGFTPIEEGEQMKIPFERDEIGKLRES